MSMWNHPSRVTGEDETSICNHPEDLQEWWGGWRKNRRACGITLKLEGWGGKMKKQQTSICNHPQNLQGWLQMLVCSFFISPPVTLQDLQNDSTCSSILSSSSLFHPSTFTWIIEIELWHIWDDRIILLFFNKNLNDFSKVIIVLFIDGKWQYNVWHNTNSCELFTKIWWKSSLYNPAEFHSIFPTNLIDWLFSSIHFFNVKILMLILFLFSLYKKWQKKKKFNIFIHSFSLFIDVRMFEIKAHLNRFEVARYIFGKLKSESEDKKK